MPPSTPLGHGLTMHIFDDALYHCEALHLPEHQHEDDVDAQLVARAKESGIANPVRFLSLYRSPSTTTVASTHSTTDPSDPSDPSDTDPRDAAMDDAPAACVHRDSIASNSSTAHSVLSNSSSLQTSAPRKKRASGLFSLFRKDSNLHTTCPSPSHDATSAKVRGSQLACGHWLSPAAIRMHIREALLTNRHALPSCCGIPLPRTTLESVLTPEEVDRVLGGAVQSPEIGSLRDSGYSESGMSSIELSRSLKRTSLSTASKSTSSTPLRRSSGGESPSAEEGWISFRAQQKEQFRRVAAFECNQHKALSAHHQFSLRRLAEQHESSKKERKEQHVRELEDLEDAQLTAEDNMRNAQEQEAQNVATALRHMEAYCLSSNSDPDFSHTVTQDDFKKLDRQRLIQQSLPRKHESAINVLRARQERTLKLKNHKQQADLDAIDSEYEKERAAEDEQFIHESARLGVVIEARRKRLLQRWELKSEVWRRDWETQHGTPLSGRFEHEDWPLVDQDKEIPASSALAQFTSEATQVESHQDPS